MPKGDLMPFLVALDGVTDPGNGRAPSLGRMRA
jgi:hypothetical protein